MPPSETWTFGYGGRSLRKFANIASARDAVVVDIRIFPHSKRLPEWGKDGLVGALGHLYHPEEPGRYVHFPEWGNRNRFTGGPMEIADWEGGYARFLLLPERPVILLCACRNAVACHRGLVARLLRERGFTVREMPWPVRRKVYREPKYLTLVPG